MSEHDKSAKIQLKQKTLGIILVLGLVFLAGCQAKPAYEDETYRGYDANQQAIVKTLYEKYGLVFTVSSEMTEEDSHWLKEPGHQYLAADPNQQTCSVEINEARSLVLDDYAKVLYEAEIDRSVGRVLRNTGHLVQIAQAVMIEGSSEKFESAQAFLESPYFIFKYNATCFMLDEATAIEEIAAFVQALDESQINYETMITYQNGSQRSRLHFSTLANHALHTRQAIEQELAR